MKKNVLILYEAENDDWTRVEWTNNSISNNRIYRKMPLFLRALRRKTLGCSILRRYWYYDWVDEVKNAETIIIHVSSLTIDLPGDINRINPTARVIIWYWNTVANSVVPDKIKGRFELWSFDQKDCSKYGMKFNHQYYFKSIKFFYNPKRDIYFCGRNAGRGKILKELNDFFINHGITALFQVVGSDTHNMPDEMKSNYVPYSKVVENISESKCILEILQEGQVGASIRTMEAIFSQRKLITNNTAIVNEPFYCESNIFLLTKDNIESLPFFLKNNFVPYERSVIDSLDVHEWLLNFEDCESYLSNNKLINKR